MFILSKGLISLKNLINYTLVRMFSSSLSSFCLFLKLTQKQAKFPITFHKIMDVYFNISCNFTGYFGSVTLHSFISHVVGKKLPYAG